MVSFFSREIWPLVSLTSSTFPLNLLATSHQIAMDVKHPAGILTFQDRIFTEFLMQRSLTPCVRIGRIETWCSSWVVILRDRVTIGVTTYGAFIYRRYGGFKGFCLEHGICIDNKTVKSLCAAYLTTKIIWRKSFK